MANLPTRQNNPGDLKDPATGTIRTFPDANSGLNALKQDLIGKVTGNTKTGLKPTSSLLDFANTWAPSSDNNNPTQYAQNLAKQLGVDVHTPIGNLKDRIDDFAKAVGNNEGWQGGVAYADEVPGTQTPNVKLNTQQFAQKIKAKYPQYSNLDDNTLTQKILSKYPQYASSVDMDQPKTFTQEHPVLDTASNVVQGAGKGLINSLYQASALNGPSRNEPDTKAFVDKYINPTTNITNTPQQVGNIGEQVGEFMAGGGVAKNITRLGNVGKEAGILAKAPNTLKNIQSGLTAMRESPQAQKAVDAIKPLVEQGLLRAKNTPEQILKNVSVIKGEIGKSADALKSELVQKDVPYIYRELASSLKNVKLPGLLKNNTVLQKTYSEVVDNVLKQAKEAPAKVSNVLELRKWLDDEVERQFGNIYNSSRDLTPVRQAVKATRDALHQFIKDRVPGVGLDEALSKQSSLYDVLDNVSEKGASIIKKAESLADIPGIAGIAAKHPLASSVAKTALGAGLGVGATALGINRGLLNFGQSTLVSQ